MMICKLGDHDVNAFAHAVEEAKKIKDKPHFIKVRTTIGFGSKFAESYKVKKFP